jgi:hypothetical protein
LILQLKSFVVRRMRGGCAARRDGQHKKDDCAPARRSVALPGAVRAEWRK